MGRADVGDHAHVRRGEVLKRVHIPRAPHAKLEHTHRCSGREAEQGEGNADGVVEVAGGLVNERRSGGGGGPGPSAIAAARVVAILSLGGAAAGCQCVAQDVRDHGSRGGLAARTGDGDDVAAVACADRARERLEGAHAIARPVGGWWGRDETEGAPRTREGCLRPPNVLRSSCTAVVRLDDDPRAPLGDGVPDEARPVVRCASDCEEPPASHGIRIARVRDDGALAGWATRRPKHDRSAGRRGNLIRIEHDTVRVGAPRTVSPIRRVGS